MLTMYKYKLDVTKFQTLTVPKGSGWITLCTQNGIPVLYAMVDLDKKETETWCIDMIGTGQSFPNIALRQCIHIGTVDVGPYVWHYFLRTEV